LNYLKVKLNNMKTKQEPKKGRGRPKGKLKEPITAMVRASEIIKAGGMDKARELIANTFSKL